MFRPHTSLRRILASTASFLLHPGEAIVDPFFGSASASFLDAGFRARVVAGRSEGRHFYQTLLQENATPVGAIASSRR